MSQHWSEKGEALVQCVSPELCHHGVVARGCCCVVVVVHNAVTGSKQQVMGKRRAAGA
jgi:hypothetical protein